MRKILFVFLISFISINAQELNKQQLDSVYNLFLRMNNISSEIPDYPVSEPEIIKCGLGIAHQIKSNLNNYNYQKQLILKTLLDRPTKETSIVSPSGFFRIHYNTTGTDIPRYDASMSVEQNVQQVAIALDSSYKFEVTTLGFLPPPPDNNLGDDNKYDVYISNLGGVYGFTMTDGASIGNQKYTTYIVIDNDYVGFYSTGFAGMQVTVAHEFHHSIQLGSYTGDKVNTDLFFYELTSTSMEEFVYDSVNDYYAYMPAYFNNTSVSLGNTDGYEIAIWNIFLKDKFGFDILRRQWELLPQVRALSAISTSISENNSTFKDAFHEFGTWCFFTKHRAKQGEYFEEAVKYPIAKSVVSITFDPPDETLMVNSKAVVNSYLAFINQINAGYTDTLIILVTNGDYLNSLSAPATNYSFEYKLFDYQAAGSIKLNEGFDYYFIFNVDEPEVWSHSEFLNNEKIGEYKFFTKYTYAFPSPFIYGKNTYIFLPVSVAAESVDLNIYSPSMDLVYIASSNTIDNNNVINGQPGIKWNGLSNSGEQLASGVYIYVIKAGDETTLGKLVIFNE